MKGVAALPSAPLIPVNPLIVIGILLPFIRIRY
jgi:hypothetical protein